MTVIATRYLHTKYGIALGQTLDCISFSSSDTEHRMNSNFVDANGFIVYASVPLSECIEWQDAFITSGFLTFGSECPENVGEVLGGLTPLLDYLLASEMTQEMHRGYAVHSIEPNGRFNPRSFIVHKGTRP